MGRFATSKLLYLRQLTLRVRHAGSFRLRIRPSSGQTGHGIPVSYNHPPRHGQSRQSYPEVGGSGVRAEMAAEVWNRFTVHYTPAHGSWLNQAEIEIGIFT